MDQSHVILNGLRNLIVAAEEAGWDLTENHDVLDEARKAYGAACEAFGVEPIEGHGSHKPREGGQ